MIAAHLVFLDIVRVDGDDDLRLVLQLRSSIDILLSGSKPGSTREA